MVSAVIRSRISSARRHCSTRTCDVLACPLDIHVDLVVGVEEDESAQIAGSRAARSIVGQPRSTIDPSGWLDTGAIVVVNTAKGTIGEDTAALIGGTLINLVGLLVGEQARLPESRRRPVTLIVDEFHTMAGADYEAILSELAKYGASLILATQSLARLEALDRDQGRSLRATVFANLDGLFAFHTSAEDARYLVRELGGEIDEHDLIELGEHQCYARLSAGGERLPTFSRRPRSATEQRPKRPRCACRALGGPLWPRGTRGRERPSIRPGQDRGEPFEGREAGADGSEGRHQRSGSAAHRSGILHREPAAAEPASRREARATSSSQGDARRG